MSEDDGVYPVDSGVIRCICGFDHDDGFTIQCEKCNTWQHAICVDIYDEESVPDIYMCNRCGDRKVDPEMAAERQLKNLKKRKRVIRRQSDREAELAAASGRTGQAVVTSEGKKRGRKKRQSEVEEPVPDTPFSYYVRTSTNRVTDLATEYLDCFPPSDAITYLTSAEFSRAKSASVSVQRVGKGFGINKYGLITNSSLSRDRFVIEFCGEVMLLDEYKQNPINQYRLFGCPKPGVIFVPQLMLAIDGRCIGSDAVFIRRSATPNLRFSPVMVENRLHIVAFANQSIKAGSELTVPWQWDAEHPIQKLRKASFNDMGEPDQHCLGATAAALRNIGFSFNSLDECLSPSEPEPVPGAAEVVVRARAVKKPPTPAELLLAAFKEAKLPGSDLSKLDFKAVTAVSVKNVWVEASPGTPKAEKVKKKLSLADYKRKHA